MHNIHNIKFDNNRFATILNTLKQWDYGQILKIQGLQLPPVVEVHFSLKETGGEAEVRLANTKDDVLEIEVPKFVLENKDATKDYTAYAFIYLSNKEYGQTEHKIIMNIKARPKPQDFITENDKETENLLKDVVNLANVTKDEVNRLAIETKSFAVGGTGTRPNEDTDNAKYYYTKTKEIGGTATSDYSKLNNKPQINGIELDGNKTTKDLDLVSFIAQAEEPSDKTKLWIDTDDNTTDRIIPTKVSEFENDLNFQTYQDVENTLKNKKYLTNIPQASENIIGGVKVDKFDGSFTEPVSINEQGKLVVKKQSGNKTTDYINLTNKPSINGVELNGNKTSKELNLQEKGDYALKTDLKDKLNKNQGAINNGKILGINESGDIIPIENAGEVIDVDAELKEYMQTVKPAIASAIVAKGGNATVQDAFGTYPDKIRAIPNGVSPTETLPKQTTLIASEAIGGINLKWKDVEATGYTIIRKENIIPSTVVDGTEIYRGKGITHLDNTAIKGHNYYYRIFPYNDKTQYQTMLGESVAEINYIDRSGMKTIRDLQIDDELIIGEFNGAPLIWQVKDSSRVKETGIVIFGTKYSLGNYMFDAPEKSPENPNPVTQRFNYGNNRWSLSNVRQWLNSNNLKNEWFKKTHTYDVAPPYANQNGFLTNFNDYELSTIIDKENKTFIPQVDGGGFETTIDKMWLIGNMEAGLNTDFVDSDHIFNGLDSQEKRKFESNWWTREITDVNNPANVRIASSAGAWVNNYASINSGVRPFCQLSEATYVRWSDSEHSYVLADDSQRYPKVV